MKTEISLILFYGGLFVIIWIVFKLFRQQDNPIKKIWFWFTYILASVGLTFFVIIYIFLKVNNAIHL